MEHQQVEDITSQQGNENTGLKNNEHLTKQKGTISKATNSELEKNRSPYEEHQQTVLDYTQIQESQPELEESEIKSVKNKESIEKNQMIRERETVQDEQNYSNNFHEADAMLIDRKEQHKDATENQQPGVEESNPTEPETQEEESDNQHEERDRPQLGKTTTEVQETPVEKRVKDNETG